MPRLKVAVGLVAANVVFGLCPIARGQSAIAPDAGTLGQRDLTLGLSDERIQYASGSGYGAGVGANFPVTAYLDVGIDYAQTSASLGYYAFFTEHETSQQVSSFATAFVPWKGMKPFVGLRLGYEWFRETVDYSFFEVLNMQDRVGFWETSVGVEIPVRWFTFSPAVSYTDYFESHSDGYYSYGLSIQRWFTRRIGASAGIAYAERRVEDGYWWNYSVGIEYRY